MTGIIKKVGFQHSRGFGFVTADDGSGEYFMHANNFAGEWSEELPGAKVEFDIVTTAKGFAAVNVRLA